MAHDALERRVAKLEARQNYIQNRDLQLQLRFDELENQGGGGRNNLKLRGILESSSGSNLTSTVATILNSCLGNPPMDHIELDQVQRVGPMGAVFRVHFYKIK